MSTAAITDFSQYAGLRAAAKNDDPAVLREVAGQFEALFVQTLLKNMRGAKLAEPMFGSEQQDMYLEMMDKQLSVEMSKGQGFGFADLLVRQLGGPSADGAATFPRVEQLSAPAAYPKRQPAVTPDWSTPDAFTQDLWPEVERVASELRVPPEALLAQAALETGWGSHVIRQSDGSNSHNVFGIKAGGDWHGGTAVRSTLEFKDGVAHRVNAAFRAYPSVEAAFDDYLVFVGENPRYSEALETAPDAGRFAAALQQAGYATDPLYAAKIERVAASDTLRDALDLLKKPPVQPTTDVRPRDDFVR